MQLKTKIILLSNLLSSQTMRCRSPQGHLRLSDSLEGTRGLRKALILTVEVYYSKRVQIKVGKGKNLGLSPGESGLSLQVSPPAGVT